MYNRRYCDAAVCRARRPWHRPGQQQLAATAGRPAQPPWRSAAHPIAPACRSGARQGRAAATACVWSAVHVSTEHLRARRHAPAHVHVSAKPLPPMLTTTPITNHTTCHRFGKQLSFARLGGSDVQLAGSREAAAAVAAAGGTASSSPPLFSAAASQLFLGSLGAALASGQAPAAAANAAAAAAACAAAACVRPALTAAAAPAAMGVRAAAASKQEQQHCLCARDAGIVSPVLAPATRAASAHAGGARGDKDSGSAQRAGAAANGGSQQHSLRAKRKACRPDGGDGARQRKVLVCVVLMPRALCMLAHPHPMRRAHLQGGAPGPGAYVTSPSLAKGPAFTIGARPANAAAGCSKAADVPGPGCYDVSQ